MADQHYNDASAKILQGQPSGSIAEAQPEHEPLAVVSPPPPPLAPPAAAATEDLTVAPSPMLEAPTESSSTSAGPPPMGPPPIPAARLVEANVASGSGGAASASTSSTSATVRVFNPSEDTAASTPSELDEAFFEPSLSDVQAHHASVISRSKRLNEAPLLTSKYREEEQAGREKRKAEKWPSTTIRVKFSDGTQVQSTFPSSSPIQPVYAFVRTCLDPSASSKPFTLWQPPKYSYPEHPVPPPPVLGKKRPLSRTREPQIVIPANYGPVRGSPLAGLMGGTGGNETLNELGLVPQSVLMIRWEDDEMNATGFPAPLLSQLRQKAEPLPSATTHRAEQKELEKETGAGKAAEPPKERKIPK